MSAGGFRATAISVSATSSPSSIPHATSDSEVNPIPPSNSPDPQLDRQMLIKCESSPEAAGSSPGFSSITPNNQSQSSNLPDIELPSEYSSGSFNFAYGNSRQTNLYLFTSDGNFASISPHQMLDMKDIDKGDSSSVILSSRPLSNSSLSAGSNASPKPFRALHLNETKNDKMISGFDGRVDGLSPLSVIAVSAYQDTGHPSPNMPSSGLSRSHPVLIYQPGGDAMLSALNYNESDMLQEGGFDVSPSNAFGALDGLLSAGMGGSSAPGMRLPDLLDGEMTQESYMETGQDLQLSPQSFSAGGDAFSVGESSSLSALNEASAMDTTDDTNKILENNNNTLMVDKLKNKGGRPVKATSPSRPGTQPCPTCGKVFSNSSALTKHKLTHSDERKYVCPLCAKAFKRQDHLNGHMLTHRNKKPFECNAEGCGKSYCDARSLRRHKENHHSNISTSAAPLTVSTLSSQVTVIPGLPHLAGFNPLPSSFSTSVITSNTNAVFTESSLGNRIQYAPPPATSISAQTPVIKSESLTKTATGSPLIGSVIPTATSHLQFLAFHQQPKSHLQHSTTTVTSTTNRTEGTAHPSWQPQTINTGALLLTQNFGISQCQPQSAQIVSGAFNVSSSSEQGKTLHSELSQLHASNVKQEEKKSQSFLSLGSREQSPLERPSSKEYPEYCVENVKVESIPEQSTTQASQLSVLTNTEHLMEARYSHPAKLDLSLIKVEKAEESSNVSSLPTTPVAKESPDCPQLESPLLQQLLNSQQNAEVGDRSMQNHTEQSFLSSLQEQQQQSLATQQSPVLIPQWSQVSYAIPNSTTTNHRFSSQDPKPVECSLCQRKFKNIPALNGHMRLHGGYFKKENDAKKGEKKSNGTASHPPLTTASTNVRALIEEKIIQKRNFGSHTAHNSLLGNTSPSVGQVFEFQNHELSSQEHSPQVIAQASPILSPVAQDASVFNDFPITSQTSPQFDLIPDQNSHSLSYDWLKKLDLKQQFRVPRPPGEKHRRHSDSDHFIPAKRPCTTYTSSALADLLRRKVVAKRTCRTGSDPGEPLNFFSVPISNISTATASDSVDLLQKFTSTVPTSLSHSLDAAASELHQEDLAVAAAAAAAEESTLPILSAEDIPDAQPPIVSMRDVSELDAHCLDKTVFFGSSHDMSVGQNFPDISVSELEMMQLTSVVTSVAALSNADAACSKNRNGEDSNDDDVFLSPTSLPTSPIKIKRKHRPEPLYIPPYVNTCGFSSRLRSPRLWDPSNPEHKRLSPPPYTPPPMLSPVRSGSGLFWHIITGSGSLTPKSAPITPSFGLARKGSTGETTTEEEEELTEAPESDILPHVNIGSYYQAKLPSFNPNSKEALFVEHKADKVWDPSAMDYVSDEEVDMYLELACCATVPGGGRNKEYALHLLQVCNGRIQDAMLCLMDPTPELPANHALLTYQYSENDRWSQEEVEAYHQGLLKCDKDFFSIAKDIPTKTVKQCIQFYYLWKKVCPDEYKRIRLIRRRKEQESLYYNLRSKGTPDETDEKTHNLSPSGDIAQGNENGDLAEHDILMNGQISVQRCTEIRRNSCHRTTSNIKSTTYNDSSIPPSTSAYEFPLEHVEEFPCKICGKVFNKVKSRSAHMKSHRQIDNDKKSKCES